MGPFFKVRFNYNLPENIDYKWIVFNWFQTAFAEPLRMYIPLIT